MHKCNNPKCGYTINWKGRYKICPKCGYVMHPYNKKYEKKVVIDMEELDGDQ